MLLGVLCGATAVGVGLVVFAGEQVVNIIGLFVHPPGSRPRLAREVDVAGRTAYACLWGLVILAIIAVVIVSSAGSSSR